MLYKFYIKGRLNANDEDSAEVFIAADDLNLAYLKLINYVKHSCTSFRLMTVKLLDISTSSGVLLEWFNQDDPN